MRIEHQVADQRVFAAYHAKFQDIRSFQANLIVILKLMSNQVQSKSLYPSLILTVSTQVQSSSNQDLQLLEHHSFQPRLMILFLLIFTFLNLILLLEHVNYQLQLVSFKKVQNFFTEANKNFSRGWQSH